MSALPIIVLKDAPLEIIDGDRGSNYPSQDDFSSVGHCLFLNAGNVVKRGFDFSNCSFITEAKDTLLRKGKMRRYDVVLTTRGTVGNSAYFDDQVTFDHIRINSGMVILRVKSEELDPRYLYFFVRSKLFEHQVAGLLTGSAQPQLPIRDINRIEIPLPAIRTQRTIASILGALDDKIELNRQMNETLEAMARAIFKDWFVDFGPTRAKMEGSTPYLAPEIWSLFPARLDGEGKPEGWRAGKLGDVAQQVGQTVSPETLDPNTPYIGLEHMPRRSITLSDWEGAGKVTSGKLAFEKRDFLFGKLRPYFHKVGIAPLDGICSTDIVVLNARQRSAAAFVLVCISQDEFVAFTDRTSDGTKMPRTSWSRMERYGV